jgi:hypothetical protein
MSRLDEGQQPCAVLCDPRAVGQGPAQCCLEDSLEAK